MLKLFLLPYALISLNAIAQSTQPDSLKHGDLEAVTIVGDRSKSIPGAGQYIGIKKLEKLNQPNINAVLRQVPGVIIRDEEGFGLRPNIGLRGTSVNRSAKVTLMEDGILIAPAPYADPSAYYFPTFARMQGVEVLQGSSQIKYGPYTIGGAINLVSTPIPHSFKGFAQLSYGSFHTNQQRIYIGDSKTNFDYVFEVNRLASLGFKQLDLGGNTGFDRRDVMGKLRWHSKFNAKTYQAVTLKFVHSMEDGHETYLGLTYDDYQKNPLRRYAGTQKDQLNMNHQHISLNHIILPSKGLTINTTAYLSHTFRDWARANTFGGQSIQSILNNPSAQQTAYHIMTGQTDGNVEFQSAARTYQSKGAQLNANYHFKTHALSHNIQIGWRYHTDEADRYATKSIYTMLSGKMILSTAGIQGNSENQIRAASGLSSYLSYDIQYKNLKITPGIRYEKIDFKFKNYGVTDYERLGKTMTKASNQISIFLPGIGFNYNINKHMSVYGGLHKGFSPPGMPSTTSATGQAEAETSLNTEIGYRVEADGFNIHLTGFSNNYNNILGSDNVSGGGSGSGDMYNAGNAKIQGVEACLFFDLMQKKGNLNKIKLPFTLTYTFTSAQFEETFINGGGDWGSGMIYQGDIIPFITPHLLTSSIGLEAHQFDVTLSGRYTGITRIKPSKDEARFPSQEVSLAEINSLRGFLIIDLSANYKINKKVTAFSALNNITNSRAIVTNLPQGYRPNMPLSIIAGFKIHL